MMISQCLIVPGFLFISLALASNLPITFKKCSTKDSTCLKKALQELLPKIKDGFPNFKIPPIDPLKFEKLEIGAGANAVQVAQKFNNLVVSGFSTGKIEKYNVDLDKGRIEIAFVAPQVTLRGSYEMDGKILLLPLKGSGPFSIVCDQYHGDLTLDVEMYNKNGQKHFRIKSYKFVIGLGKAVFDLQNLFGGDKELGDTMNKAINDNWEILFEEVRDGYGVGIGGGIANFAQKLFDEVPVSEFFLE